MARIDGQRQLQPGPSTRVLREGAGGDVQDGREAGLKAASLHVDRDLGVGSQGDDGADVLFESEGDLAVVQG